MEVNISRTTRLAALGSVAPSGAAPITGALGGLGISMNGTSGARAQMRLSLFGEPSQPLKRIENQFIGDIVHDVHLTNLAREDEVHGALKRLLVRLQAAQNTPGIHLNSGQRSKPGNRSGDPALRQRIKATIRGGDVRSGHHAPGNGLAVQKIP